MKLNLAIAFLALLSTPAHALQALKQCNDVASLEMVKKIDAAEVRINEMQANLDKATSRSYPDQQKAQVCPQLQSQFQSYVAATKNLASAINTYSSPLKEIGADSCVSELNDDIGQINKGQNLHRGRINSIFSRNGSGFR